MKIEEKGCFIEFEFAELCDMYGRFDVSCRVKAFCDGFGGEVNSVWFAREDADSFIEALERLDETRKGAAELLEMSAPSPACPFGFTIFVTDSLGHLAVRAALQKTFYLQDSAVPHAMEELKTSVVFEIDPTLLSSIIRDFKKLFKR